MAPRKRSSSTEDAPEIDRIAGYAHPRETQRLVGQDAALARAARAIRGGHPPQGWLLAGPPGIGKATLAYRIARYLLAFGATDRGPEDLSVPERDPAALQMTAGAHPGLLVLKRGLNDQGRLMKETSVKVIRQLGSFFGMTSGAGGWRVVIVDTADDMTEEAANALLKLLEEPPSRAMLLLLSNRPGSLLPTIRSRCQRLDLRPLHQATLEAELARLLPDTKPAERAFLAQLSGGSLGTALQLAGSEGLQLAQDADRLLDRAAAPDFAAILALGDRIARITDGLDTFGGFLLDTLASRIGAKAQQNAPKLDEWVACLQVLRDSFTRSVELNLEPRQTLLSTASTLASAGRRGGSV